MERRCRYRHGTLLCVHAGERGARTRSAGGSEGGEWASAAWWSPMGVPPIVAPRQLVTLARGVSKRAERQPKYPTKSRSVPTFPNSRVTRVSHPRCRRCWLSRALPRVASRPTIDATPHPRCDACHPTLPTWSVHPRAPDHPSDENQKAPRAKPNDALGPSI